MVFGKLSEMDGVTMWEGGGKALEGPPPGMYKRKSYGLFMGEDFNQDRWLANQDRLNMTR